MKPTTREVSASDADMVAFFAEMAKAGTTFDHRKVVWSTGQMISVTRGAGVAIHIVEGKPVLQTRLYLPTTDGKETLKMRTRVFFEDSYSFGTIKDYLRESAEALGTVPEETVMRVPLHPSVRDIRGTPTAILEIRRSTLDRTPAEKIFRRLFELEMLPEQRRGFPNDTRKTSPPGMVVIQGLVNGSPVWKAGRNLLTPQNWDMQSLRAGERGLKLSKEALPLDELIFSELAERFLCTNRANYALMRMKYFTERMRQFDEEIQKRSPLKMQQPSTFQQSVLDDIEANLLPLFVEAATTPSAPENISPVTPNPAPSPILDEDDCDA